MRRWLIAVLSAVFVSLTGLPVRAVVETGGTIAVDTTWTNRDTVVVSSMVIVSDNCCLTIQAGTIVQFVPSMSFYVIGEVVAEGGTGERIVFTVRSDTVGGDPSAGAWNGLTFMEQSRGTFKYCDFRYGLNNVFVNNAEVSFYECCSEDFVLGGIYVNGSATDHPKLTTIDRCTIRQTDPARRGSGVGVFVYYAARVDVYRSRISACQNGIEMYGTGVYIPRYKIANCDIFDNAEKGIYVHPGG
ncbi:MAG: right-handed parallel beta-helix repeat-containing protein [Candidatus Zixiibacteriota bacterium]